MIVITEIETKDHICYETISTHNSCLKRKYTMAHLILSSLVHGLKKDDSGATAIEYGLIAALISVVIVGTVTLVGSDLSSVFESVSSGFSTTP